MSIFTVRPTGPIDLMERGLATVYKNGPDGKPEAVGPYSNSLLPGGFRSHRVFFDTTRRLWDIGLTREELNEIAKGLKLTNNETRQLITTADPTNEYDPFFIHLDLTLEVPVSGISLDDETPWGKFWYAAIQSEPKKFDVNSTTDNPLVRKIQEFKVTTADHTEKVRNKDAEEGFKASGILHAKEGNFKALVQFCRGMDIVIGENPDIEMMRTSLFVKITTEKDFKTKDGVRNIERFLQIADMKEPERNLRDSITYAVSLDIIKREGRNLVFEDLILGTNNQRAYEILSKKENTEAKGNLLARIAERSQ